MGDVIIEELFIIWVPSRTCEVVIEVSIQPPWWARVMDATTRFALILPDFIDQIIFFVKILDVTNIAQNILLHWMFVRILDHHAEIRSVFLSPLEMSSIKSLYVNLLTQIIFYKTQIPV